MAAPRMNWEMNINTWISIAGFVVLLGSGVSAYSSFKAETEEWRREVASQLEDTKVQQSKDAARIDARAAAQETTINALSMQTARSDARFDALVDSVNDVKIALREQTSLLRDWREARGPKP